MPGYQHPTEPALPNPQLLSLLIHSTTSPAITTHRGKAMDTLLLMSMYYKPPCFGLLVTPVPLNPHTFIGYLGVGENLATQLEV